MLEEETICPYTGLRSFTEEESLYFKGREEQINQVIVQLEEKKFLMVTGASGDGKSSLIFAGLIPQARAGFFKARYSNWHVADFRPERSPLKNMATSLSTALKQDTSIIETELSRGFSSLVELYKSSVRYTDTNSVAYQDATEDDQRKMERESGNLLILIDQFEEFFTNPENFPGGVPSQESRLLLNIILETAKISLKEDLPIYIVCTMRSDYIGQCAAFRGLPEFIGFSQFFVPRLQRKELYQVIEEPAILSGNRISKRLIDRLISDVEEGTDHLPILQHALKEIWKAASNGRDEMDLLHYAMVGGMHGDHLPKEVKEKFQTWRNQLPQHEKDYLNNPGLANVLDIHANKLYEGAAAYCAQHGHPEITTKQARFMIAMSFACLTRIDENRAVRNRMTLQEITQIINVPQYNVEVVGTVLSIFREPENTLVRPFIQNENANRSISISADDVFDITHEALIRNWMLLKKWADQEFDYYNIFLDFQKQVERWMEHGKSDDFLLPIGPLTYFENWYKKCRPNHYWINRYHTREERKKERLRQSSIILKNGKEYLRKSSLKLFVTRTVMKYGAGQIAAVFGFIAFIVLSGFGIYKWQTRQNDYVIESILKEGEVLLQDKELISFDHAFFTVEAERVRPGYFKQVLQVLPEQQKINVASNFMNAFMLNELRNPPPILRKSIIWTDSLVRAFGNKMDSTNASSLNQHLINLNALVRNLSYYLFYNPDEALIKLRIENARFQAQIVQRLLGMSTNSGIDMKALHIAATDAMNYNGFSSSERASLITELSPFSNREQAIKKFVEWFPSGEKISAGAEDNFSHNGAYQMLAYWYASLGNVQGALQCLDSLKKYNQNYDKIAINSTHVSAYFLMYGQQNAFIQFAKTYSAKLNIPAYRYSNMLLDKAGFITDNTFIKFIKAGNLNDNFIFLPHIIREQLFKICREFSKTELKAADALNFNLALLAKQEGIFAARYNGKPGVEKTTISDSLFNVSLSYYNTISSNFLNEKIETESQTVPWGTEKRIIPRKHIFLYPGHFKAVESFMAASVANYSNDSFFHFMLSKNLFAIHYKGQEDYQLITSWISTYFTNYQLNIGRTRLNYPDPGQSTFLKIDSLVRQSGFDLDNDWVKLVLIRNYLDADDTTNAFQRVRQLTLKTLEKPYTAWDFRNFVITTAADFAMLGKRKESMDLLNNFTNRKNRLKAYGQVAFTCQLNNKLNEANVFFDSANAELSRLKSFNYDNNDFRLPLVGVLALQNNRASEKKALEYIGSMQWYNRSNGIYNMSLCYAHIDEFYKATRVVPGYASYYDKVIVFYMILFEENMKKGNNIGGWEAYARLMRANIYFNGWTQNDALPD